MIEPETLRQLVADALARKLTWLEAGEHYSTDEWIDSFRAARALTASALADLDDGQVWFTHGCAWSVSEMITHLIHTQESYQVALLNFGSTAIVPDLGSMHGSSTGGVPGVSAHKLRAMLREATFQIDDALERTRFVYDPTKTIRHPLFGAAHYNTWLLSLLLHEVDHGRQIVAAQRLAQVACAQGTVRHALEPAFLGVHA